jgi:hypothetical protein
VAHRTSAIANDLNLDVPRPRYEPLEVVFGAPERNERLRLRALERLADVAGVLNDPHASAATAHDGLQLVSTIAP